MNAYSYFCRTFMSVSSLMSSLRPSRMPLRLALFFVLLSFSSQLRSALPERTAANVSKYADICKRNIYKEMRGMYREAGGSLKYKFLAPGSSQYLDMLWDWDSWLSNVALRQILLDNGTPKDSIQALDYERGCVLNSLSYCGMDGWIPIWIERNAPSREEMLKKRNPWKSNMHKPTLAQHAAFIVRTMNGDAEWLRDDFYYLQAFVSKYMNFHRHKATGLLYWETDEAIGVDNDPSTFYRPHESSGSIFLNALMYKELQAMAYIARCLSLGEIAAQYDKEAADIVRLHYRDTTSFNAPAGIRSLSPLEKMYNLRASGNPSSWQGPIWINVNYLVFRGLLNYGYTAEARELAEKTIILLGRDFERFGALHEYYLPENGEPVLNKGFQNWNFLVLNMIAWLEGRPTISEF